MSLVRARIARAAATAAVIGLGLMGTQTAIGAPSAEPPSTPVPVTTPDGQVFSYVVNVKNVNPGQVRKAEKAVTDAGGVVVQS